VLLLLQSALRLCLFRPPRPGWQEAAVPAVLLRGLLLLAVQGGQSFLLNGLPGHLAWSVLPDLLFPLLVLWLSCWMIAGLAGAGVPVAALLAELLAARLLFGLLQMLVLLPGWWWPNDERLDGPIDQALNALQLWWLLAVLTRIVRTVAGGRLRTLLAMTAFAGPWLLMFALFQPADLWQADAELADGEDAPAVQAMPESVFHGQAALFDDALDALEGERPGVDDLYFLGVAGDAGTPAFRNEVEMAAKLFEDRFDTRGRSLLLVNDGSPEPVHPFATRTNLDAALARLGEVMDVDDDILLLFLSSHGTREHTVVLAQPALALADIDPASLRTALDEAGIRWRIVIVSACYSGGFVEALRDDHTLVITASDADHPSFGCGAADRYTWFGQALFDEQLRRTLSLPSAFRAASRTIAEREKQVGEQASNPQLSLGSAMAAKLTALERRLSQPDGPGGSVQAGLPSGSGRLPGWLQRALPGGRCAPAARARADHRRAATQAGMSGVSEQARIWISSFSRNLRFFNRRSDSSSATPSLP